MQEFLLIAGASLALGMRHATDPDHLLAVSTMVCEQRSMRGASRIGALWGLGHSCTVSIFGGAIIAFRLTPSVRTGLLLELAVALMLILLGAAAIVPRATAPAPPARLRPFVIGLVHGLAGSAAAALLILSTIADPTLGLAYLAVFSAGTLAGMSIITSVFALPSLLGRSERRVPRWMRGLSGALTLAIGCYLAYRIGFVDGLLNGVWR